VVKYVYFLSCFIYVLMLSMLSRKRIKNYTIFRLFI